MPRSEAPADAGPPGPGPAESEAADPAPPRPDDPLTAVSDEKVRALLGKVVSGEAISEDIDALWLPLLGAGAGDIEKAIAVFRRRVAEHPTEADAHYGLGLALIAKLSATKVTEMELATLGVKADACFTKALDLDDYHFSARFSKAYCYAFWPPNTGKGPEAIRHFEILVERHGGDPGREGMEEVYYNLGKEYAKLGNFEKARECYREGLRVFPDSKTMQGELGAMDRK